MTFLLGFIVIRVLALNVVVEVNNSQTPACLLEGSSVLFTCVVEGFPHPEIIFRKDSVPIRPGTEGFNRVMLASRNQVCVSACSVCQHSLPLPSL